MKNPEAAINFINCVAFEASISDLIRIHTNFLNTNRLKNKSNENN